MTDTTKPITVDRGNPITTLCFNRPETHNALTAEMLAQACDAVGEIAVSDARVVILTGAGTAFCSGIDLGIARDPDYTAERRAAFTRLARRFQDLIETMRQPVIAKIRGACMTGGLEIALAADLIVAASDARFADTHAKFGFVPEWGMPERLAGLVGRMRAKELAFSARIIDGREAASIGLILEAVAPEALDARVAELANAIAANCPRSLAGYKHMFHEAVIRRRTD